MRSTAIVLTLARFGPDEAHALTTMAASARAASMAMVAVPFGAADAAAVKACANGAGIALAAAGSAVSFGAAANAGARAVDGDDLVFINGGDLDVARSGALLAALGERDAGAVGPRVRSIGGPSEECGIVVNAAPESARGFAFGVFAGARVRFACDALPSDALATPRSVFDRLGGFAEEFGSDLESIDYCLRAGEAGLRVWCDPTVSVLRLAASADRREHGPAGEAAFDARWRERIEPHENFWPELTGSIVRREYHFDGVLVERLPIPKVALLVAGAAPPETFVAALNNARMRVASATLAENADVATRAAREMTELRGPDYVAFVRSDSHLGEDWLNELVNAIERTPDTAVAVVADPPDARCALVTPRRIPQHLRIEPNGSFDAAVAAWFAAIEACGRTIARVRRTTTVVGAPAADAASAAVARPATTIEPFASIVMLSWNAPDYTVAAIESIRARTPTRHEIIIVDNGSGPETLARLAAIPDIRVIANAVNTGFAFGCNQGIAAARGTHVVLLNNDVIVPDGWLEPLLAVQRARPTVGCSAPRSNRIAGLQQLEVSYSDVADMPAFAAKLAGEQRGRWTHHMRVIGVCMCTDRRVIDEIGGLDPRYGSGNFEDDDYCMRIVAAGYEIAVCEDAFVHHFGSVSFRTNDVDYRAALERNLNLFVRHWNVTDFSENSYDPRLPPRRGFRRERDYVALPAPVAVGPDWTR